MKPNAFIGQTQPPTEKRLADALGPAKALWDQLVAKLVSKHDLKSEWKFYSIKMGWSFRLKRSERNIVYFGPHQGSFLVALIFGDKALAAVLETKWPQRIRKILDEAPRYPEGTGVRIEMVKAKDIPSIVKLAEIKLAN
jgi:hypothetical protein